MRAVFSATLLFLALAQPFCDDGQNELEALYNKALWVHVSARLISPAQGLSWSFSASKLTIPGRPVPIQLRGSNLRIDLELTPYTDDQEAGKAMLVVQSQVWASENPGKDAVYASHLKSIPVALGESIQFYPLGLAEANLPGDHTNVELEIQITAYKTAVSPSPVPTATPSGQASPRGAKP
jgi:hypothetical protein